MCRNNLQCEFIHEWLGADAPTSLGSQSLVTSLWSNTLAFAVNDVGDERTIQATHQIKR